MENWMLKSFVKHNFKTIVKHNSKVLVNHNFKVFVNHNFKLLHSALIVVKINIEIKNWFIKVLIFINNKIVLI